MGGAGMMDKAQLLALADRVEALTGPDRGIDRAIATAIRPEQPADKWAGRRQAKNANHYTSSISAAMSLHPSEPWLVSMMTELGMAGGWRVELSSLADGAVAISDAGCDAARAFTAASLRAMAGGDDGNV